MIKFQNFKFLVVIFSFSLLTFSSANAAVLYLQPAEGRYYQGDTFVVSVRIDTEEECVNVIDAALDFPNNLLEVADFSTSNSLISIWLNQPVIDQNRGQISFSGGIPAGFCGILPGDPGESNLLLRVMFKVKETEKEKKAEIRISDDSQVLLNDGLGTRAKLTSKGAVYDILSGSLEISKNEWETELLSDNIPPEFFEIELVQDPLIFNGKYFIVFSATDKQTGIDYYQVKEGKKNWKRGESPYLLEDQNLSGIIKVKAVDKAGNERIAEYAPEKKPFNWRLIILISAGIIFIWLLKRKLKNQNAKVKITN